MSRLASRVAKLEQRINPKRQVPTVIPVNILGGETLAQACDRFRSRWGQLPKKAFVVPQRPSTAREHAAFKRAFKTQQLQSMEDAKSSRPKETEQC